MNTVQLPEIIVVAGPNGSGKSTLTRLMNVVQPYINADDIKKSVLCSDEEAAVAATKLRQKQIDAHEGFTFETVLSSRYALEQLWDAKKKGFFIRGFYVFPASVEYNLARVISRESSGGHSVPKDKIIERYWKSIANIPEFVSVCDVCNIYDNTSTVPFRIFKKELKQQKCVCYYWENGNWNKDSIVLLTSISDLNRKT